MLVLIAPAIVGTLGKYFYHIAGEFRSGVDFFFTCLYVLVHGLNLEERDVVFLKRLGEVMLKMLWRSWHGDEV